MTKFYAVRRGRQPGLYKSWKDCEPQVDGYRSAEFKGFPTRKEAEAYLDAAPQSTPDVEAVDAGLAGSKRRRDEDDAAVAERAYVAPNLLYRLEFDGAARGNPGPSGYGAVLMTDSCNEEVGRVCGYLGVATNNVAEYTALIRGMEAALAVGVKRIKVLGDSQLVVKQVEGIYRVHNDTLAGLHKDALRLSRQFGEFSIAHIYRESNTVADHLSNMGVDGEGWSGILTADGVFEVPPTEGANSDDGSQQQLHLPPLSRQQVPPAAARRPPQLGWQQPPKTMIGGSWAARRNVIAPAAEGRRLVRLACSTAFLPASQRCIQLLDPDDGFNTIFWSSCTMPRFSRSDGRMQGGSKAFGTVTPPRLPMKMSARGGVPTRQPLAALARIGRVARMLCRLC